MTSGCPFAKANFGVVPEKIQACKSQHSSTFGDFLHLYDLIHIHILSAQPLGHCQRWFVMMHMQRFCSKPF